MCREDREKTDDELVDFCLSGQSSSYEVLVDRYKDCIYNLAYRMSFSGSDAEEMTQETFIRAYQKLNTFRKGLSFRNWLMAICANKTKNLFRGRMRRRTVEENYSRYKTISHEEADNNKSNIIKERFELALTQLDEKSRIALVLKHVEGYSYEEASEILDISVSAAKMRVKRGRDELVRILKGKEVTNENE